MCVVMCDSDNGSLPIGNCTRSFYVLLRDSFRFEFESQNFLDKAKPMVGHNQRPLESMEIPVVEFSSERFKIRKVFG